MGTLCLSPNSWYVRLLAWIWGCQLSKVKTIYGLIYLTFITLILSPAWIPVKLLVVIVRIVAHDYNSITLYTITSFSILMFICIEMDDLLKVFGTTILIIIAAIDCLWLLGNIKDICQNYGTKIIWKEKDNDD